MAAIERFEDVESWKLARILTKRIYELTYRENFAKDFALRDQIRRAVISIGSNIAEGFERGGDKEFIQFLSVAKGSCGEVRSQLYFALDLEYLDKVEFESLCEMLIETNRRIAGLMNYLRQSELRGIKYRRAE